MLSKVSIKDHPHHEQIVELAKEIHAREPKHLRKGKNARDYLLQVKTMLESSISNSPPANLEHQQQQKGATMCPTSAKVSFSTIVKEGKAQGAVVFPPKLGPTGIPISQKLKGDWQTVQRKKATWQGTKANMVSGIVPVAHQIPREMLLSTNEEALTRHFTGILDTIPGADALLINNPLKRAAWSLNRDILHMTFALPLDNNLRAMTHHAFRHFFNVSDDSVPLFIECPTISSVKWAHVPCYDADNKEITEQQLADQILHQGLFAELKVMAGPLWIVPSTGDKGSYATIKMDFKDNCMGSNLKIFLNKNIFLNGKVCRTLPWVNQSSTPQCTQCL